MSSLSQVLVEQIEDINKHENANSLELLTLTNGFTVIDKIGKFQKNEKVQYVPVDMKCVNPENPEFEFLGKGRRVRGKKIRGIISCGLALKLDDQTLELNTDLTEQAGFEPYEAPEPHRPGASLGKTGKEVKPPIQISKYDIESIRKYHKLFNPEIIVTEKSDGCFSSFLYHQPKDGEAKFYLRSRTRWLEPSGSSVWDQAAEKYNLEEKLKTVPNLMLCGEIYGWVQSLRYGAQPGEIFFAAFDIYNTEWGKYLNHDDYVEICDSLEIPRVPEVYRGPWQSLEHIKELSEMTTKMGNDPTQIAEGVVVKYTKETWNPAIGRFILKMPSDQYLTRK